jgi:hypothetical protein
MSKMNTRMDSRMQVNKILVVGHPQSGYESVAGLLDEGGMSAASPSKREKMQPADISKTLLKSHKNGLLEPKLSGSEIEQLTISPVWNGMALDLMLGNINQPFWYWADALALPVLNYWKALDSQLAFVLVYDSPKECIAQAMRQAGPLSPEALELKLLEWFEYNRALLKFYHGNSERSLLVHTRQVNADAGEYLKYVRRRTGIPLLAEGDSAGTLDLNDDTMAPEDALQHYIIEEFLQLHPGLLQFYEELQSVADLSLGVPEFPKVSAREAWTAAVKTVDEHQRALQASLEKESTLQAEKQNLEEGLIRAHREREAHAKESEQLLSQLHDVQEQLEQLHIQSEQKISDLNRELSAATKVRQEQIDQLQKEKHNLAEQLTQMQSSREAQAKESEQLLSQLHDVQEQLEQLHIQSEQKISGLNRELAVMTKARDEQIQRLEDEKQELVEQVKRANRDREAEAGENELLLSQLHAVQEQLEQLHMQSGQKISGLNQELAAMTKARDEQSQRLEDEKKSLAEQVEQLNRERGTEARKNELLLSKLHGLQAQLKHLEKERDALALQKGQMVERSELDEMEQENALLLEQLHRVQEELERYYLENRDLKKKIPVAKPRPYGAAERVKRQLSYRLGATMINQSRSFSGWVTMPTALMRETRQYRSEFAERSNEKLPPIHRYTDAHEAERVKNHLSYRLGQAMVANARTPIGWVKLPWALRKAHVEYRKYRADV